MRPVIRHNQISIIPVPFCNNINSGLVSSRTNDEPIFCFSLDYHVLAAINNRNTKMDSAFQLLRLLRLQTFVPPVKNETKSNDRKMTPLKFFEITSSSKTSLPACAILTTSEWLLSITGTPFTDSTISPISRPDDSAGVSGSIADTTTGFEP